MRRAIDKLGRLWKVLREDRLPRLVFFLLLMIVLVSVAVYLVERLFGNPAFGDVGDALWWAVVTMTTVGYGDITPASTLGKVLSLIIMGCGISLTALLTAEIASYFVEKRIREGKGMEEIKFKKHVILCGWNSRAMKIIEKMTAAGSKAPPLVLVNELPEEHVANILSRCEGIQAKYVRGDYVHEGVLQRANVAEAEAVLLLIDTHGARPEARPDDRTVLAAFTIKNINTRVRVCAEVETPESIAHLKRAGVETVVQLGGYNDFLLYNAAVSPGVTRAVQEILTYEHGHLLQQFSFPASLVDKSFKDAIGHFREHGGGLLLGVAREEEEGMSLDDILTGEMSAVDRYIKKKFEGLENTYFTKKKRLIVNLNPPDDYIIKPQDMALVIAREERD